MFALRRYSTDSRRLSRKSASDVRKVVEGARKSSHDEVGRSPSLSRKPSDTFQGSATALLTTVASKVFPTTDPAASFKPEVADGILNLQDAVEANGEVMCLRFSPDSNLLAAGYSDGVIKIYNSENLNCMHTLFSSTLTDAHLPVTGIRFLGGQKSERSAKKLDDKSKDKKNLLVASYTSGCITYWHYPTNDCIYVIDERRKSSQSLSLAINNIADTFVTVGADPQIFLYDLETKKRLNTLEASEDRDKMDGHKARVFAVQFHPSDPHVFLSGGWDDTVHYWDSRNPRSFRRLFGPHICGDALDLDPSTSQILTGSWRKEYSLQIWDFASGEKIADVPDDYAGYSSLYCAQWFGRDHIVCGGCNRNRARIIDRDALNTVGSIGEMPQGVYCLDSDKSASKTRLAVGALKKVYIMKVIGKRK